MGIYGIVSGGVEVDSVTIDTNAEGELQVKNGLLNTFGYSSGEQIGEVILESQGVNSSTTDYVLTKTIQTSGNAFLGRPKWGPKACFGTSGQCQPARLHSSSRRGLSGYVIFSSGNSCASPTPK